MIVQYEDTKFYANPKNSLELHLLKQALKRKIGKFIKKPYIVDEYLAFARQILDKKPSSIVVDIGSNIGTTVLPLARRYREATFYAIEPHPIPASRFIQNCEINQIHNVNLISCAIGSDGSLAKIYTCPNNSGGHRLTGFEGRKDLQGLNAFGPISIPTKPLKQVFEELGIEYCDILKIDTEGYESSVLSSLNHLLDPNQIKYIVAELGEEGLFKAGSSPSQLFSIPVKKGYKCRILQSGKEILSETDLPDLPPFVVKDLVFYTD